MYLSDLLAITLTAAAPLAAAYLPPIILPTRVPRSKARHLR